MVHSRGRFRFRGLRREGLRLLGAAAAAGGFGVLGRFPLVLGGGGRAALRARGGCVSRRALHAPPPPRRGPQTLGGGARRCLGARWPSFDGGQGRGGGVGGGGRACRTRGGACKEDFTTIMNPRKRGIAPLPRPTVHPRRQSPQPAPHRTAAAPPWGNWRNKQQKPNNPPKPNYPLQTPHRSMSSSVDCSSRLFLTPPCFSLATTRCSITIFSLARCL